MLFEAPESVIEADEAVIDSPEDALERPEDLFDWPEDAFEALEFVIEAGAAVIDSPEDAPERPEDLFDWPEDAFEWDEKEDFKQDLVVPELEEFTIEPENKSLFQEIKDSKLAASLIETRDIINALFSASHGESFSYLTKNVIFWIFSNLQRMKKIIFIE